MRLKIAVAIIISIFPLAASAQIGSIRDVRYDITFDSTTSASKTIKVAMSFSPATTPNAGPVLLSLPAWTPGAYELSNFAKWVSGFRAVQNGKDIRWDKVDFDTWRIQPSKNGRVSVSFDYLADSLDNAMAWAQRNFLLFNGTNVFMYPEGQIRGAFNFPATVVINTHSGWNVATGMEGSSITRTYTASNYHDLADMPFFIGEFDVDSAQVSGKWIRYATYPKGSVAGKVRDKLWSDIKRMIPQQVAVFGEAPWKTYTVMQISTKEFGGASGLEHQNSHVDIVAPMAMTSPVLPSLYSHEIFHSWNVKRLRPYEMWPYRYDEPQPTTLLWVSEGITDYYADIAEVRGGVINKNEFYSMTTAKIDEIAETVPVALEDASLSTWIHPTDGSEYTYYAKGSVAGLLLDILIRDASNNKSSLDDVLRTLYNTTYKRGIGFTDDQFWATITAAANGKSFDSFYKKYVDGRDPYPYKEVLSLAGMRFTTDTIREPRLGVATEADSAGVFVISLVPGGTAATAGVKIGDYIVAVGSIDVHDQNFGAKFRAEYSKAGLGTPVSIKVIREEQALTLTGSLNFAERTHAIISDDPNATKKAVGIRESLLSAK